MKYKPDYGLFLMNAGVGGEVDQFFYDFRLYSLTVLGVGEYSTMVEYPSDGKLYALSLDFNGQQLQQILATAPPEIARFLRTQLSQAPATCRTIDFSGEAVFGVRARLGQIQRAPKESFVPFVAQEIL
jgi:hypothetical protein